MNNTQKKTAPEAGTPEAESREKSTTTSITEPSGKIKVVLQHPGEVSVIATVPNTLKAMQQAVGGYIETLTLPNGLLVVLDEEGRLKGLKPNVRSMYGVFVGTVLITKSNDEGELVSLTPEQIQLARTWLLMNSI